MSITLNTVAYGQDVPLSPNKVPYVGPDNSYTAKDLLTLGRTAPKPTSTYAGNARYEVKRTKTVTLADSTTADIIVTTSFSIPVGAADADIDSLRDDVGDFLISADCGSLVKNGDLTY